jgi:3'-5' exoribonuclease
MDAKMETLKEALADVAASDTKWQGYNRLFESNIRRTSPQDL